MTHRNTFFMFRATTGAAIVMVAFALAACGKSNQAEVTGGATGGAPSTAESAKSGGREVNDANCQFEAIKQIKDKTEQQEFASQCQRRGTFKPTTNKSW